MSDLAYISILEAHELLVSGKITARKLTEYHLSRLEHYAHDLGYVITKTDQIALEQADQIDQDIAAGKEIGLLAGIPYTAKDMILTKGIHTTAGSHILENFVPPYSATVIEKLDAAGAVLIAKVNQDEFGHGGSTENSAFHPGHNPWDTQRVPGGSSGGSAAAVAAGVGMFSIGTDTGGSIRQPAAFCGVVGMKPTYGLVSRSGVVAMASSLDTIGPIARSAEEAALILDVIAGRDPKDSTTIERAGNITTQDRNNIKKVGIITNYMEGLSDEIKAIYEQACEDLKSSGIEIVEKTLVHIEQALPTYYIVVPSEISSNLSRYDGVRYGYSDPRATNLTETYLLSRGNGFGEEVRRRVMIGTYALSAGYYDAYYKKAMQLRTLIIDDFTTALADVDVLIGPTTPTPAFHLGENVHDPVQMYLADIMTVGSSLAGLPSVSVPSGIIENLPMGLQIIGRQNEDSMVLSAAARYQEKTSWHTRRPTL